MRFLKRASTVQQNAKSLAVACRTWRPVSHAPKQQRLIAEAIVYIMIFMPFLRDRSRKNATIEDTRRTNIHRSTLILVISTFILYRGRKCLELCQTTALEIERANEKLRQLVRFLWGRATSPTETPSQIGACLEYFIVSRVQTPRAFFTRLGRFTSPLSGL